MGYETSQGGINPPNGATPAASVVTTATGIKMRHFVGYQPINIRALWATIVVAPTVTAVVANFKFRPTPGSASGEVSLGTLTLPISAPIGNQYYKKIPEYKALPGGELVVDITTASTAGEACFGMFGEPAWDNVQNNTKLVASV